MEYDYIIVGAGLSGGVLARKLAEEYNKKILIVERRNHIAGNMYDYNDDHGIKVQKYGPHVFHTNFQDVYDFIIKYCEPLSYRTRCRAVIDNISTPSPFNFKTIDQFYNKDEAQKLKQLLLDYYDNREAVTVVEMLECEESSIKSFAQFLFDKDYKLYTAKQWNLRTSEIDPSVLKRVPIILSYRDTYFGDKYEFMPGNGFAEFYENLIDHFNITLELGVDALAYLNVDEKNRDILYDNKKVNIIYTGAIDELFNYKFGVLPYRSLYFEYKSYEKTSFQDAAIVAYPQAKEFTRITEYTKMPLQKGNGWTSVVYEYPVAYDKNKKIGKDPYYPVLTDSSRVMYKEYSNFAANFKNLTLCGRLAEFKYYNMDQCVLRALEIFENMEVW